MVDPQICKILLAEVGLSEHEIDNILPRLLKRIGQHYREMDKKLALNPGVKNLLETFAAFPELVIGVLTGNLRLIAEEKLRITGIRSYFSVLFCADDYFDRPSLVKDAVETCMGKYHLKTRRDVVIVGDTPRDMEAANASSATSVGVASGTYTMTQLIEAKATYVYPSLEPTPDLMKALGVPPRH